MTAIPLDTIQRARFNNLMEQTYRKVFNLAYRLVGNRNDAEDLTQEAYYRAYRGFRDFEGDRPFENWIFRIVTRLFLDLVRSRGRRVQTVSVDAPFRTDFADDSLSLDCPDQTPNPEQLLLQCSVSEELEAALANLKPEQRMLVLLADVENIPYNQIATMLKLPVGTIRSRLHRAHKQLRSNLSLEKSNCLLTLDARPLPAAKPNCSV